MRSWSYGVNAQSGRAHIELRLWPWWVHLAEWFAGWIHWRWLARVPLPRWPLVRWSACEPGERYSPREWYGDLGGLVFAWVSSPIYGWVFDTYGRQECRTIRLELDYTRAKDLLYRLDPEFFDHHEAAFLDDGKAPQP